VTIIAQKSSSPVAASTATTANKASFQNPEQSVTGHLAKLVEQKGIHSPPSRLTLVVVGGSSSITTMEGGIAMVLAVPIAVVSAVMAVIAMIARHTASMTARAAMARAVTAMNTPPWLILILATTNIILLLFFLMVHCWFWAHMIQLLQLQLFTVAGMCRGVVHVESSRVSLCHGLFFCHFGRGANPGGGDSFWRKCRCTAAHKA
jgi:hypothetical protein